MRSALFLAGLLLVIALAGVEASSLQGCDEAYYAQMARGMLERRDWLVPRYDGAAPLDKPPLLLWLVAASFAALGVGDLQARLPLIVLGFAVPMALFGWARRSGEAYAFVAAATLGTTLLYVQLQHAVMTDLVAFAGFVAFAAALLRAHEGPGWGWLVGLGLGMAALAKGALAALLVLASLPFVVVHRGVLSRAFLVRCIPGLLPATGWYAAMAARFGWQFFDVHFGFFLFRLAAEGIFPPNPLGPFFYVASALWRFLPWWPLLPGALWWGYRRARRGDPMAVWAVGFCAVYFVAITLMRTKHDHYALPLTLPAALLTAGWCTAAEPPSRPDRVCAALYGTLAALVALAAGLVLTGALPAVARPGPQVAVGFLVACGFAGAALLVVRGRREGAWGTVLVCSVLAYAVAGAGLRPWDAEPGLRVVAGALPQGADVTYVAEAPPEVAFCPYSALRFRLDRPPRVLSPQQFGSAGPGWYVGRVGVLHPAPRDRVVFRGSGWVLVRRPD